MTCTPLVSNVPKMLATTPMEGMNHAGLILLIASGLSYTGGVAFYVQKKAWAHPVWHLFVLGGSACHYFAVLWYSMPAR